MKKGSPKFEENKNDARLSFFYPHRRLIRLEHIVQQVGGSKKKAMRVTVFHCTVPLITPLVGFPAFIQAAYTSVNVQDSYVSKSTLDGFKLPGINIEFYSTENSRAKDQLEALTNLTLYDFCVERVGDGEDYIPVLRFKFKVQENRRGFNLWLKHGMTDGLWANFVPADSELKQGDGVQMSLIGDNGPADEDEDDEGPEETGKNEESIN